MRIVGAGGENLSAFVEIAEFDDLNVDPAHAPVVHAFLGRKIDVDGGAADEGFAVVVDHEKAVVAFHAKLGAKRKARPVGGHRMILGTVAQVSAECGESAVFDVIGFGVRVGSRTNSSINDRWQLGGCLRAAIAGRSAAVDEVASGGWQGEVGDDDGGFVVEGRRDQCRARERQCRRRDFPNRPSQRVPL